MGSMALQLKPFTVADPLETYERAMSLRALMDERRYRALREQQTQQKILEDQEERQQAMNLRQLFSTNPNPTTADVMRAAPGMLGFKWATEQRLTEKARQDAAEAAAKASKEALEAETKRNLLYANKAEGYLWQPDVAERQRMYQTDTPDFLRLGVITPEQAKAPLGDDTALEAIVAQGKGREYLVDLKGKIAKQKEDRAEAGRKTFDEQLKLFGRVLGYVKTPEQWNEIVEKAPVEVRMTLPRAATPEELPALLRQANLMTMTPAERQAAEPKTLAEWLRISLDQTGAYSPTEKKMADQMVAHLGKGQSAGTEAKLRDDYRADKDVLNYIVRRDAINEIRGGMQSEGGISDIKLIFNYIRMQDPTSTVRESEASMVSTAAGISDQLSNLVQRVFKGEKLPPNVRADILRESTKTYNQAFANYNQKVKQYREISERNAVDWRNVLIDYSPATPGIQSAPPAGAAPAGTPTAGPPPPGGVMPNVTVEDIDRELRNPQLSPPPQPTGQRPFVGPRQVEEWEVGPDGRPRRKQ